MSLSIGTMRTSDWGDTAAFMTGKGRKKERERWKNK